MLFPPAPGHSSKHIFEPVLRKASSTCTASMYRGLGEHSLPTPSTADRTLCQSVDLLIASRFLVPSRTTLRIVGFHLFQRGWRRRLLPQIEKQSHFHPFRTGKDLGCRTLVPGTNKLKSIQRVSQEQTRWRLKVCHQGSKTTSSHCVQQCVGNVQRNCLSLPRCEAAAPPFILIEPSVQTASEEGWPSRGARIRVRGPTPANASLA